MTASSMLYCASFKRPPSSKVEYTHMYLYCTYYPYSFYFSDSLTNFPKELFREQEEWVVLESLSSPPVQLEWSKLYQQRRQHSEVHTLKPEMDQLLQQQVGFHIYCSLHCNLFATQTPVYWPQLYLHQLLH